MTFKPSINTSNIPVVILFLFILGIVVWQLWQLSIVHCSGSTESSSGFRSIIVPDDGTIKFYTDGNLNAVLKNKINETIYVDSITISDINPYSKINISCNGHANPTVVPSGGSFNLEAPDCSKSAAKGYGYVVKVAIAYHFEGNSTTLVGAGTFRGPFRVKKIHSFWEFGGGCDD
jgi:hypothetical protein